MSLLIALLVGQPMVNAQVGPSPSDVASYDGIHAAAWSGDVEAMRRQLRAGVDHDVRDRAGRTALHVATFASHDAIVDELLRAGADIDAQERDRYDAITIAAVADDVPMVELLLRSGGNTRAITSRYDGTALIAAAHLGHHEIVSALIRAGAPLDHINNLGWTALIEAVILGDGGPRHVATVRALVEAGANRAIADRGGATPLDHARARGYRDMVAILERP